MKFQVKFGFILLYNICYSFCKQFIILIFVMSIIKLKVAQKETDLDCLVIPESPSERAVRLTTASLKTYTRYAIRQNHISKLQKKICFNLSNFRGTRVLDTFDFRESKNKNRFCFWKAKCGSVEFRNFDFNISLKNSYCELKKPFKHYFIHWKSEPINLERKFGHPLSGVNTLTTVRNKHAGANCRSVDATRSSQYGITIASANLLPDFTTEKGIFTGLPPSTTPAPPPPPEFDVNVEEAFASFTFLKITWKAIYDVTKIRIQHTDKDSSHHTIELKINLTGDFTPNIFKGNDSRRGFIYKLGSLYGNRRYYLQVWATADNRGGDLYTVLSFLSGDQDVDDRVYNLNGIFLVLGISTIIMLVVMICVGYEKLLLQKRDSCKDFLCCRKSKQSKMRPTNGTISPEPLTASTRRGQVAPIDESSMTSTTGFVRY